jgi:hypothetical protein
MTGRLKLPLPGIRITGDAGSFPQSGTALPHDGDHHLSAHQP